MGFDPTTGAYVYTVEGFVIFGGNLAIILAVLTRRHLRRRKELLIIVSMSLGDAILGLAYLTTGVGRAVVLEMPTVMERNYTSLECFTTTPVILFFYGSQCMCLMMLAVSVDRLMAVAWPAYHFKLTPRYVYLTTGVVYLGYGSLSTVGALVTSYGRGSAKAHSPLCPGPATVSYEYFVYHMTMQAFFSSSACIMYIGVVVRLWLRVRERKVNSDREKPSAAERRAREQQDRVTRLLAFVVSTTFLFYTIPYAIFVLASVFEVSMRGTVLQIGTYAWILAGVNSVTNVLIYGCRHSDIRRSIVSGLTCAKYSEVEPISKTTLK